MTETRLGVLLWNQASGWPEYEAAARKIEALGYDSIWAWDHLYAIFGDPYQDIFEGYTTLAALAGMTSRVKLGLLVGANTFRNPGVVAKALTTIDHASHGRAIAGIGGAWMEPEHTATGIDFGSGFGERLDRLDEAVGVLRAAFDGKSVTSPAGGIYSFKDFVVLPRPVQAHLPIMIGGSGEKKTLRTVAKYADMWNAMGAVDMLAHKVEVLKGHCDAVGRDPSTIEFTAGCKPIIRDSEAEARRVWEAQMAHNKTPMEDVLDDDTFWVGTPELMVERMQERKALGFHTFLAELAAPYDDETIERWIGEVLPKVDAAS
jgi:alkanesulfonate monooxygenase SsuD/methylene tetrahydromethanopterin reductase-like flavin-dependent oxidoreductase (luciferase family)